MDFSLSDRLYLAVSPTVTGAFEIASKVSSTSVLSFLLLPLSVRLRESERVVPIYWPKILRRGSHHGLTTAEAKRISPPQMPSPKIGLLFSLEIYGFVL